MTTQTTRGNYAKCLGYEQITALNTAKKLTPPNGARVARIVAEAQAVRWIDDGSTAPTTTVGMPLAVATELFYDGNLGAIQFIEQTASAKLNVSYYA